MTRIRIFALLVFAAVSCSAQSTNLYDSFKGPWLNPQKWLTVPTCSATLFLDTTASINLLDCTRAIDSNKLHLRVKAYGNSGSDQGRQFGPSELYFANPNSVNGMVANLTVTRVDAAACSSNSTASFGQTILGGSYFNSGSGDPSGDVAAILIVQHNATDPAGTLTVSGLVFSPAVFYGFSPLGTITVGESVVAKVQWDKANHAFVFGVNSDTHKASASISYSGSDEAPPVAAIKLLAARAFVPNCTTSQTSADIDVLFGSVSVN